MKKMAITALIMVLAALWGWRVYDLNHDPVVEYARRETVEYAAGEPVDLVASDFPSGWADLTGYHMKVTGARLVNTIDLLRGNGYDESFFDTTDYSDEYALVILVDTVFWYDGAEDPKEKPIDLTNLRLVGADWDCWYCWEIEELGFLNPVLEGGSIFAIVSGKELALTLPFILKTDPGGFFDTSIGGVTAKDILKSPPRLLLAEYPTEVYAALPALS